MPTPESASATAENTHARTPLRLALFVLCLSFSVTGAGLIVIGTAPTPSAEEFKVKGDDATAVVTDISLKHQCVLVQYRYRDKTFERTLPWYSSLIYEGQEVPIHVAQMIHTKEATRTIFALRSRRAPQA